LELIKRCLYRGDNTLDMLTCKIHCHHQTCSAIPVYGDPSQYEAGSCERGLKTWAKRASRTAQKNQNVEVFSLQTASRVSDSLLLAKASDIMGANTSERHHNKKWVNIWHKALAETVTTETAHLSGNYFFARSQPHYHFDTKLGCITKDHRTGKIVEGTSVKILDSEFHKQILYAVKKIEEVEGCSTDIQKKTVLNIWTEVRDGQGNYLRATPNYAKVGPWYDWVFVHFRANNGEDTFLPAKCILFYLDSKNIPSALVHGVGWKPIENKVRSMIFTEWQKEYKGGLASLTKVPISSIQQGLYAFEPTFYDENDVPLTSKKLRRPEDLKKERVFVLSPRSTWASKFYQWCLSIE